MPKGDEHLAEGTFTPAAIERVRRRALQQFANTEDFDAATQRWLHVQDLRALPRLDNLKGFTASYFRVYSSFRPAGVDLAALVGVLHSWLRDLPNPFLSFCCHLVGGEWVKVELEHGRGKFDTWLRDLLSPHDAGGREAILNRVIQAARLPVVVRRRTRRGKEQVNVESPKLTGRWRVLSAGNADQRGALSFDCEVPPAPGEDVAQRVQAAVRALDATPQAYSWAVGQAGSADCLRNYGALTRMNLPGERYALLMTYQVTALGGLEGLRRVAEANGREQFPTTLCRFPIPVDPPNRRRRLATVTIHTTQDGHALSVALPARYVAVLPEIGTRLGLSFPSKPQAQARRIERT
jgi:hypothetical protein